MFMIELLFRDLLTTKGLKTEYVGDIKNIGYDFIVGGKLRVELKSVHSKSFSMRRNSGNGTEYIENLDFLIVIQCWNDDLTYWVFPERWGKPYDLYRIPFDTEDIIKYRNNFSALSEKITKLKARKTITKGYVAMISKKNTEIIYDKRQKGINAYIRKLKKQRYGERVGK